MAFQSPQWGSNSKVFFVAGSYLIFVFSPRNGEVILKFTVSKTGLFFFKFQSPQWGSNSKGYPLESA